MKFAFLASLTAITLMLPHPGEAQQRPAASSRCLLAVKADRASQVVVGIDTNLFAGGNVRLNCSGTSTTMQSDSLAWDARQQVVQFIGRVRYRDSTITMDSDRGTYYSAGERWEARGRVVTRNLNTGSKLTGPTLDYLRELRGVRDTFEMYAAKRPRIEYVTADSAGQRTEPYIIVADRVRFKGNERIWGGGKVTIDRSDFVARGDSLYLDTGKDGTGTLIGGNPVLRGTKTDSFNLYGNRIDFRLQERALTRVIAKGAAHADSKDWRLTADTIALDLKQQTVTHAVAMGKGKADSKDWQLAADTISFDLKDKAVEQVLAWGDSTRALATSTTYAMKADSLALDTPQQKLREIRGFGAAWLGGDTDSASKERNWMRGDTIHATFAQRDSAGTARTTLSRVEARHAAQSYHVDPSQQFPGRPSINYARGDEIIVTMRSGEQRGVERVDVHGQVDGVHLEAVPVATHADSVPPKPSTPPPSSRSAGSAQLARPGGGR